MARLSGSKRPLLVVLAGTLLVTFDGSAVQMALPALRRDLRAGVADVHWVMTAYLLVSTMGLLPAGRAGDLIGRVRIWRAGVALFATASLSASLMPGLWWLVAARSLQGLGAALVTAQAAAILSAAYPRSRGLALGIGNIAVALGLVAGPIVGALLTAAVSWRLLFAPAAAVGVLALWGSRGVLRESELSGGRRDVPGVMLPALAIGALVVGGAEGIRLGWTSTPILSLLLGGALLLLTFIWRERHAETSPFRLLLAENPTFRSGALASLPAFFSLFTVTVAMPFFLIDAQGRGLVRSGLMVGMVPLGLSLTAPLVGALSDRVGSRWPCVVGLAVVATSQLLVVVAGPSASTATLLLAMALTGVGLGGFEAPNTSASLGSLDGVRLSLGAATLGVLRNLGMTLGTATAATLLALRMDRGDGAASARAAAGVRLALLVGAAAGLAGALAAWFRPPPRDVRSRVNDPASASAPVPDPR